jgi:hypothetical protein
MEHAQPPRIDSHIFQILKRSMNGVAILVVVGHELLLPASGPDLRRALDIKRYSFIYGK